jgi:hypothetical protein
MHVKARAAAGIIIMIPAIKPNRRGIKPLTLNV